MCVTALRPGIWLACAFLLIVPDVQSCPVGFTDVSHQCLSYHITPMSWTAAETACANLQGHLVAISDEAENSAVVNFRKSQAQQGDLVWLGMRLQASWKWYDDEPVTWSDWKTGSAPTGAFASSCGVLDADMRWSEFECGVPLAFMCQYTAPTEPTPRPKPVSSKWWKFASMGRYSGVNELMTVTSPSRLHCASQCMSTKNCDAIGYHDNEKRCQMIAGEIAANQIVAAAEHEVWVKNQ